jgi:hypothetical protein
VRSYFSALAPHPHFPIMKLNSAMEQYFGRLGYGPEMRRDILMNLKALHRAPRPKPKLMPNHLVRAQKRLGDQK